MARIIIVISAILLILTFGVHASNRVIIYGQDSAYAGSEIVFSKYSERIANREIILAKCIVASDGQFSMQFNLDEVTFVFSQSGIYKMHLFAVPGSSYEIILPPQQNKQQQDMLNPYFLPTIVHLATKQYLGDELNTLIRMFNDAFQPYYNKHISELNQKNDFSELDKDIAMMDKPFSSSKDKYFNDFRKYRYALLRYLAYQRKSKSTSDDFFKGQPVLTNNPAYMDLFNQVYEKYFYHFSQTPEGKQLKNDISASNFQGLKKTLSKDKVLGDGDLLDLVILKGLYDEFYDDNYSRSALLVILDSCIASEKNFKLKEIAGSIRIESTKLLTGFEPPDFQLYDRDSNLISLESLRGKYVYLNFCSCFSYTCLNEFTMLSTLYEKHKDRLDIVTIVVDNDKDVLNSFLQRSNYPWIFLHYGNQSMIIQDYDIRAFPIYYLIDPQGKLAISPAPSPGEEFEGRFFNLLRSRGEI